MRREVRVLLNEKMEPPLINWCQSAGGLRHSVGSTRTVIDQRHLADQGGFPCGLDHIITKPDAPFPFKYTVHLVTLVACPEKEIAGRELQRVGILTKKLRRIHECSIVVKTRLQRSHYIWQV